MTRRHLRNHPTLADMARAFGPVDAPLAQLAKGYVAADGETGALSRGELIAPELVAECQAAVVALKRALRKMDVHQAKSLCNTASIEILMAEPNTERKAA